MADVNRTDWYEASFESRGWKFKISVSYAYDSTIAPGKLTREKVIAELDKYRESKVIPKLRPGVE